MKSSALENMKHHLQRFFPNPSFNLMPAHIDSLLVNFGGFSRCYSHLASFSKNNSKDGGGSLSSINPFICTQNIDGLRI